MNEIKKDCRSERKEICASFEMSLIIYFKLKNVQLLTACNRKTNAILYDDAVVFFCFFFICLDFH